MTEMSDPRDRLIVALDVASVDEAERLVDRIGDAATFYKIGYRLAYAGGLALVPRLAATGRKVFLDLKLHDIGNTVEEGVRALTDLGATFLTVHAYPQTMRAAVRGRGADGPRILAVTVLTSYDDSDAAEAGYALPVAELVARRAAQAAEIGIDGIVCSAAEAQSVRGRIGPDRAIVTPGIRPSGAAAGDQKRVMTPGEARRIGIDHVVVGRPITQAADPRAVAAEIVREMENVAEGR
ncbi:orotidine-5'-phosphate decarboxylase [Methylobacterium sp. J-068]|uniref:orotidine-5'-phosphate decarboxylase n=1 Tax=Methylobacterium sp. J-068 TaxID=2836649 RepID=UPI001FB938E1|nr:orotidine-5'-phosphate decarboxylase [Methylobacterium sp. J-068]MCJ2033919.1 orotidine-5'-phosphate decarboxylase [Methylobacterium sp. J-068]